MGTLFILYSIICHFVTIWKQVWSKIFLFISCPHCPLNLELSSNCKSFFCHLLLPFAFAFSFYFNFASFVHNLLKVLRSSWFSVKRTEVLLLLSFAWWLLSFARWNQLILAKSEPILLLYLLLLLVLILVLILILICFWFWFLGSSFFFSVESIDFGRVWTYKEQKPMIYDLQQYCSEYIYHCSVKY